MALSVKPPQLSSPLLGFYKIRWQTHMCLHKSAVSQLDPLHSAKPFSSICMFHPVSVFIFLFSGSIDPLGGPPGHFIDTGWLVFLIYIGLQGAKTQKELPYPAMNRPSQESPSRWSRRWCHCLASAWLRPVSFTGRFTTGHRVFSSQMALREKPCRRHKKVIKDLEAFAAGASGWSS